MKTSDFNDLAPGRLIRDAQGYLAFLPAPLPPKLTWTAAEASALSAADQAVGRLAGVGQGLANPHLLIGPFIRREAVLSSRIEGTQASLSDLLFFEAAPDAEPRTRDVREVANYVRALEYGLERINDLPLSLRLIREMHARLLSGVRGELGTPGEFRRSQNWIGPPGCTLTEATFVPPPPSALIGCLDALEKYLHATSDLPPLVRYSLIHYQFEAIHPFLDGNGRIGRLLITLLLCLERVLPQPLLYLSAYFEKHRSDYYEHLLRVSRTGAWDQWVRFFLRGVEEQALDAVARASRLLALNESYRGKCLVTRGSPLMLKLVDQLFRIPATSARGAADFLSVTFRSAQNIIDKLVEFGILKEVTGKKRNRVYLATGILEVVDDSP